MEEKIKLVTAGLTLISVVLGIIKIFMDKSKKQENVSVGGNNEGIINGSGVVVEGDNKGSITQNSGNTYNQYNNTYQVINNYQLSSNTKKTNWQMPVAIVIILFSAWVFRYIEPYLYLILLFFIIRILIFCFSNKTFLPYKNKFSNVLFALAPIIIMLEKEILFNTRYMSSLIEKIGINGTSSQSLEVFTLNFKFGAIAFFCVIPFLLVILAQLSSFLIPLFKNTKILKVLKILVNRGFMWVSFGAFPLVYIFLFLDEVKTMKFYF